MIELTEGQKQALRNGESVRLNLPEIAQDVVVVPAMVYESIRDILVDEQERRTIARLAVRNAAGRLLEDEAS